MPDGPAPEPPEPPELPAVLVGPRVRLIVVTPDDAADMAAGRRQSRWHPDYPRRDDVDAASMVRPGPGWSWGPRHVVADFRAVGSIGCYGAPAPGPDGAPEVELGYGLVAEARGHGLATESLRLLLAETDRLRIAVRAAVRPDNAASLRVLARCGFTGLRGSDEEGQLVMARPLPSAPAAPAEDGADG